MAFQAKVFVVAILLFTSVGCGEFDVSSEVPVEASNDQSSTPVDIVVTVQEGAFVSDIETYSILIKSSIDGNMNHEMEKTMQGEYTFTYKVDDTPRSIDVAILAKFDYNQSVRNISPLVNVRIGGVLICKVNSYEVVSDYPPVDAGCVEKNSAHTSDTGTDSGNNQNPPPTTTTTVTHPVTSVSTLFNKQVFMLEAWGSAADVDILKDISKTTAQISWGTVDIGQLNDPAWRAKILEWKALIPDVPVHCYVNYQEFFENNAARVWQQSLRDEIVSLYPEYQLNNIDGTPISVWSGMIMNNLLSTSPVASNGLTIQEWYVQKLVERMKDPEVNQICDGFHLDNQNYITSWIVDWLGPMDADYADVWDWDLKWQEGLNMIIDGIRTAFPDKEISCRSKSHRFLEKCDRVIFEQMLKGPPNTDIPGGWLGRIHQARIMQKYTDHVVLHHDFKEWWLDSAWQGKVSSVVETAVATCLVNDFECAFDMDGDSAHDFTHRPEFDVYCGAPLGDRIDAFVTVGSVPGTSFLGNGQTLGAIYTQPGDTPFFWRDIFNGDMNTSVMTGITNAQRWNAGLFAAPYDGTTFKLGFSGIGQLMIEDLVVYRSNDPASTGYDYREFQNCEAFVNMTTSFDVNGAMIGDILVAPLRDGRTVTIEPGRACLVTYDDKSSPTNCMVSD